MSLTPPVVIVHGFLATKSLLWFFKRSLQKRGFRVHQTDLSFLCIQDVKKLAQQLERTLEEVCIKEGCEQVDVVGVSQGGVIGLYLMRELEGSKRLRRLVAVGSPFHGTWAALPALPVLGLVSKGIWQILPKSRFSRSLTSGLPEDSNVMTIAVAGDPICPERSCRLDGAMENYVLKVRLGPLKHQLMAFHPRVLDTVKEALHY